MKYLDGELLEGSGVPKTNGTIHGTRGKNCTVGRASDALDRSGMPFEDGDDVTVADIPENEFLVTAAVFLLLTPSGSPSSQVEDSGARK